MLLWITPYRCKIHTSASFADPSHFAMCISFAQPKNNILHVRLLNDHIACCTVYLDQLALRATSSSGQGDRDGQGNTRLTCVSLGITV